jgi:hypothetical protein
MNDSAERSLWRAVGLGTKCGRRKRKEPRQPLKFER